MKVYFDTNVLVSAFTARGLCADLMRVVLAEHQLFTGEVNLRELHHVLIDKFHAPKSVAASVESQLRDEADARTPRRRKAVFLQPRYTTWSGSPRSCSHASRGVRTGK